MTTTNPPNCRREEISEAPRHLITIHGPHENASRPLASRTTCRANAAVGVMSR